MHSFTVNTSTTIPYDMSFHNRKVKDEEIVAEHNSSPMNDRNLDGLIFATPNDPLVLCSSSPPSNWNIGTDWDVYGDETGLFDDIGDLSLQLGRHDGCASFTLTVPGSFNANYDTATVCYNMYIIENFNEK